MPKNFHKGSVKLVKSWYLAFDYSRKEVLFGDIVRLKATGFVQKFVKNRVLFPVIREIIESVDIIKKASNGIDNYLTKSYTE